MTDENTNESDRESWRKRLCNGEWRGDLVEAGDLPGFSEDTEPCGAEEIDEDALVAELEGMAE